MAPVRDEEVLMDLLLFGVWPIMLTLLVCSFAAWLLPRVHILVGAGVGLLMGMVNMWAGMLGVMMAVKWNPTGQELGAAVVGSTVAVFLGCCIPVAGMWLYGWLKLNRGRIGQ